MALPQITHLQFLVLRTIAARALSGRELRQKLGADGGKKSLPAFYQMMSRLEDAGLVRGFYETQIIDGQRIQERWYRITPAGTKAANEVVAFYTSITGSGAGLGEVSGA